LNVLRSFGQQNAHGGLVHHHLVKHVVDKSHFQHVVLSWMDKSKINPN
jgi:hypothetical protein